MTDYEPIDFDNDDFDYDYIDEYISPRPEDMVRLKKGDTVRVKPNKLGTWKDILGHPDRLFVIREIVHRDEGGWDIIQLDEPMDEATFKVMGGSGWVECNESYLVLAGHSPDSKMSSEVCGTCGKGIRFIEESDYQRYGQEYIHTNGFATCLYANDHFNLKWFDSQGRVYIADPKPFRVATANNEEFKAMYYELLAKSDSKPSVKPIVVPELVTKVLEIHHGRKFRI